MKHTLKIFLVSLVLVQAFSGIALAGLIAVPADEETIQQGLDVAQQGDTVLVASGTYYEAFIWPATNGIKLLSEAGAESTTIDGSNLSSVIYFPGLGGIDSTTVVKGFRITNGGNVAYGGGIYMTQSSPTIEDCVVDNNNSTGRGGGIYCDYYSNPTLDSCIISGNSGEDGGGISCYYSSSPTLTNCTISGNSGMSGGGIHCEYSSSPTLDSCTINGNSGISGGGIACWFSSNPTLTNCIIGGNSVSGGEGGGIYCYYSSPTLDSCTIISNSAYYGGGIECADADPTLTDCTISGNSASREGGGICCYSSSPSITNCTISGNSAVDGGGIHCLVSSAPDIKNCTITDNRASDKGDGIYTAFASWPTLDSNNICHNGYGIYNDDSSDSVAAENQWWGDALGPRYPDQDSGGQGDSISHFVDAFPWLTEADTIAPPIPPILRIVGAAGGDDSIHLDWSSDSAIGDLAGYKIYFDNDSSGFPYSDTIDIGMNTGYTFTELAPWDTYYVAVTCYDNSGNESWYSREVSIVTWIRGDANGDGQIDLGDVMYLVSYLFIGGPPPDPMYAGDANCSKDVDLADAVYIVSWLFLGGPPPRCP